MQLANPRSLILALAAFAIGASVPVRALTVVDNFSSVADGTLLSGVSGWTSTSTGGTVSSAYGYGGSKGAQITGTQSNTLVLTGGNVLTSASGQVEFKSNILVADDGAYNKATLLIGKNDGVNAFVVYFFSGNVAGTDGNSIALSNGGGNWGTYSLGIVTNSTWIYNHWYEVTLTTSLPATGAGNAVSGLVSIYDLTTSSWLIQNVSITATGSTGNFDTINAISLKQSGAGPFDVSNLQLGVAAIPEPATAASLAGLTVLGLVSFARRSRKGRR
jgi:hypothetical protein